MEVKDSSLSDLEQYGAAGKFVTRAKNTFFRSVQGSAPPSTSLDYLVTYLLRVRKLGPGVIRAEQREAALELIYGFVKDMQRWEAKVDTLPPDALVTTGTAEETHRYGAISSGAMRNRAAASDSRKDPAMRYLLDHDPEDQYADFRDPAIILSNYKIRASEHLKTVLPPRRARQYVLTTDL